ncbi:MAG: carbohydrate-binding protein, partial [Anaerolineaceae bacterium]|nr:carbohydrate-binding protein [Anaerolineaceae bacterium]
LGYATSTSPLGPFTKRGILIDNTGCDAETWNNHGSIAEFNDQWYVFYHRSSQGSMFNRRVCVEPIHFNADGSISEVEMTTQGVSGPLPATQPIEAWRACLLHGKVRSAADGPTVNDPAVRERLTQIHLDDWAAYKYIDFDAQTVNTFHARVGSLAYGGRIEIHLDQPDGELIGTCEVPRTGGWQKWSTVSCQVKGANGIRAVYLVFKGAGDKFVIPKFDPERLFDLDSFWFMAE